MTTAVASTNPTSAVDAPADTPPEERHRALPTTVVVVAAVVMVLYAASAALFSNGGSGSDFHRRQAAAIADGHLDIRPVPDALRRLPDPYDARSNLAVRVDGGVQDLAYRDGRLYSAHGLTVPVLLLPSEALFGTAPTNAVLTVLAGWAGFLAGVWLLVQIRWRFLPSTPDRVLTAMVLAFGLCGPVWVLMSTGHGYEVAIAAAFALTMLGSALLLRATVARPGVGRWSAAGGSVCLALAIGARPTAAVGSLVVAAAAVVAVRERTRQPAPERSRRRLAGDLAALLLPYVAVAALLGVANVVRFGSPIEFGFGFQLSNWNMTRYPMGRPGYLLPNLADYLLAPPRLVGRFPWVRQRALIGGDRPDVHTAEPIVGLVFLAPVLVVGLAALVAGLRSMHRRAPGLATIAATSAAVGTAALVAVSFPFNTSTLRYAADAAPMLLVAAGVGWAWQRQTVTDRRRTRDLDRAWTVALVIGVVFTALVQVPV